MPGVVVLGCVIAHYFLWDYKPRMNFFKLLMTHLAVLWRSSSIAKHYKQVQVRFHTIPKLFSPSYLPRQFWNVMLMECLTVLSVAERRSTHSKGTQCVFDLGSHRRPCRKYNPSQNMNLHTSALNGLGTTILSDLYDMISPQPLLWNSNILRGSSFQNIHHYYTLDVSSVLVPSLNLFRVLLFNSSSSTRLNPITSSGFTDWFSFTEGGSAKTVWNELCFPGKICTTKSWWVSASSSVAGRGLIQWFQNNWVLRFVTCLHNDSTHMKRNFSLPQKSLAALSIFAYILSGEF